MIARLLSLFDRFCCAQLLAFAREHGMEAPAGLEAHVCASDPAGCGRKCQTTNTPLDAA